MFVSTLELCERWVANRKEADDLSVLICERTGYDNPEEFLSGMRVLLAPASPSQDPGTHQGRNQ